MEYSPREMMAIAAGRFIEDGDVLFAGTGVAMLAAAVAKRIHAPHAHIFFETGGIGPLLEELPMAVADPRVMAFSNLNAGLVEAFSYVANRRLHTIAFLGAAQIDRYGNMNSTVIGDYHAPKVRFSGSGGGSRQRAGYRRGGPIAVVTNLCVLKFDDETHEMYLAERYDGVTPEQVQENTGFALDVSRSSVAKPPDAEELRILRDEIDPQRLILG